MAFFQDAPSSEASENIPLPKLDLDLSSHFAAAPRPQRLLKTFLLGSLAAHLCIVGSILFYDLHWKPNLPPVEVPVEVMSEAEAQKQTGAAAAAEDKKSDPSVSLQKGDGKEDKKAGESVKEANKAAAEKAAQEAKAAEQKAAQEKQEEAKQEAAKQQAAEEKAAEKAQEAAKAAEAEKKPEPPKPEPAKQEVSQQEAPKPEPQKQEAQKPVEQKPPEKPSPKMEAKARAEAKAEAKRQAKAEAEQAKAQAQQAKAQAALEQQEAKLAELRQQADALRALKQEQQHQQLMQALQPLATPQQRAAMNAPLAVLNPQPQQAGGSSQDKGQDPMSYHSQDHFDQAVATSLPTNDAGAEPVAFSQIVFGLLERAKQFPDSAKRRRAQGVATIAFSIDDSGQPQNVSLIHSSGQADLDVESLSMVLRAAPFPVPPQGAQRVFAIDVHFGGA